MLSITPLYAKTILVVGDSLSAAHNIDEQSSWVNLLRQRVQAPWQVVNISASGDTSDNGLAKLTRYLSANKADIVIIELGANDGLRGLPLNGLQRNLGEMVGLAQKQSAKVLLLATWLPPNYGPTFIKRFNQVYLDVATQHQVALIPMFLQGVAGDPALMQSDGLHPNQKAQPIILNTVWPRLQTLLNN